MVAESLVRAITETIRQNEIGNGSPYHLGFARLGKSGASFGFMQGDTNVSPLARATLRQVLLAGGETEATAERLVAALSKPLPLGNPLSAEDTQTIERALRSPGGKEAVDAMDRELLDDVLELLDRFLDAAKSANLPVDPIVCLYAAPWINMSGPPTLMISWVKGSAVHGVPSPAGAVHEADIAAYLQATAYFSAHPRNFKHFHECVVIGARYLPKE
jgi:hypothetical protein